MMTTYSAEYRAFIVDPYVSTGSFRSGSTGLISLLSNLDKTICAEDSHT